MLHAQRRFPRAFGGAVPAVRSLLHAALRRATRAASAATRGSPASCATRCRDGEYAIPGPGDDHRGPRGGERGTTTARWRVPWRAGVRGVPGGGPGHAQLRRLARCLRPVPDHAAQTRLDRDEPRTTTSCTRTRSAPPATVAVFGHYGRPVLAFPSEGGQGLRLARQRHDRRGRRADRRRPGQALLRRLLRRRVVVEPSLPLEERAREHGRYESWILDQVVPFIHHDTRRRDHHHGRRASAPSTPRTSPSSARTCSRSRSACRATTTRRPGARWGDRGEADLLQQPDRLRRAPRRRPPRVAALRS